MRLKCHHSCEVLPDDPRELCFLLWASRVHSTPFCYGFYHLTIIICLHIAKTLEDKVCDQFLMRPLLFAYSVFNLVDAQYTFVE